MISTFADRFAVQTRESQAIGAGGSRFDRKVAPLIIGQGANDDSRLMSQIEDQVKHHTLWNYVAVDRIASRMSECIPQVARLRVGQAPQEQGARRLSWKQEQHIKRAYAQHVGMMDGIVPISEAHPLVQLLRNVNPEDWWGSFFYEMIMFVEHTGEAWLWVIPDANSGLPAELWVIPTQWVKPVYNTRSKRLSHYLVRPDGDRSRDMELPPDEVLCIKNKSLLSKTRGWSPNRAGAEWIYNAEQVEKSRSSSLRYGPNPGVVLTLDPEHYDGVSPEDMTAVGRKFEDRYSGADKTGRPIIAPPGVSVEKWTHSPAELDFSSSTDSVRDAVLALRGVPKAIAGVAHDLNKASIFGANLIFCESTINPKLAFVAGALTEKLARRFGLDLLIWFEDCRPEDDEAEREEEKLDWAMGALTPDDRRIKRGREPLNTPASQQTYVASSLRTLDTAASAEAFKNRTDPPAGGSGSDGDPDNPDDGSDDDGSTDTGDDSQADGERDGERDGSQNHVGGSEQGRTAGRQQAGCDAGHEQRQSGSVPDAVRLAESADDSEKRARRISGIFQRLHEQIEKQADADLKEFWSKLSEQTKDLFRDLEGDDFQFPTAAEATPVEPFRDGFNSAMTPHWQNAAETGALFERDMLRLQPGAPDLPDISVEISPKMRREIDRFIATKQEGVWSQVLGTTRDRLEAAIADGIESGDGAREIAKRVQGVIDASRERSIMIARTETTGAMNAGQEMQRDEDGVPYKQWISTLDDRVRETHLLADQQQVDAGEAFTVGGYQMRHPGDGSLGAPAEEIINCRCTSVGSFEPLEPAE